MRFTKEQYEQAIQALTDAKAQLVADGGVCAVCGDSGHMAYECGHNPLVAVAMCKTVAGLAEKMHDAFHWLAGYDTAFGVQLGPARVVMPDAGQKVGEAPGTDGDEFVPYMCRAIDSRPGA